MFSFLRILERSKYHGLEKDKTYYVSIEQEAAAQLALDQAKMREIAKRMDGYKKNAGGDPGSTLTIDDGRAMESCSCIYGNPCVDEYGCKEWENRFVIATKNGLKGFKIIVSHCHRDYHPHVVNLLNMDNEKIWNYICYWGNVYCYFILFYFIFYLLYLRSYDVSHYYKCNFKYNFLC